MDDHREPIKEISLCLSGGGARGAFHIGVLAYLDEHDIRIKAISGTSIGALIGTAYASGTRPKAILEIVASKAFKKMIKINFSFRSLFKIVIDHEVIGRLFRVHTFEELKIPTYVTQLVLDDGKLYYRSKGELLEGVLRAISIAPIFEAVEDKQSQLAYTDGGVVDNLPIKSLLQYEYPIVSVGLHPKTHFRQRGFFATLLRVVFLAWHRNSEAAIEKSEIYITTDALTQYSVFKFKDQEALYELGYKSAKEAFKI